MNVREIIAALAILTVSTLVIWVLMIRPYSGDWVKGAEVGATVKTLMSNSNIIGGAYINAVVVMENGQQTIVEVPLKSNIRAVDDLILSVFYDQQNEKRRRYQFKNTR